ncbi:MAG: hypothetical protein QOG71_2235 [Pyrinomonadaceae bacterium]|nr:hypothetical protein [Pyrinomonadaceae bacterium]
MSISFSTEISSLLIMLLTLTFSSCTDNTGAANVLEPISIPPATVLDVYIDATPSVNKVGRSEVAENLFKSLPALVKNRNIIELRIFEFGRDGFAPIERMSINFPSIEGFLKQEMPRDIEKRLFREAAIEAKRREKALQEYKEKVQEVLKGFSAQTFLPINSTEPYTDIKGLVYRISSIKDSRPHLILVITDGNGSHLDEIQPPPPPQSPVQLVIVITPERSETSGSLEDYARKRTLLTKIVPWAQIIPFFIEDFNTVFEDAKTQNK